MRSERKLGLSTEQFPVSAYVGRSKNLKDLKVRVLNLESVAERGGRRFERFKYVLTERAQAKARIRP
jgi:hypothetical protein